MPGLGCCVVRQAGEIAQHRVGRLPEPVRIGRIGARVDLLKFVPQYRQLGAEIGDRCHEEGEDLRL